MRERGHDDEQKHTRHPWTGARSLCIDHFRKELHVLSDIFVEFKYATYISNDFAINRKFSNFTHVDNNNRRWFNVEWHTIFITFTKEEISDIWQYIKKFPGWCQLVKWDDHKSNICKLNNHVLWKDHNVTVFQLIKPSSTTLSINENEPVKSASRVRVNEIIDTMFWLRF